MATFQPLPTGAIRGDYRDLYPILDRDNLPVGFTSAQGDVFVPVWNADGTALRTPAGGSVGVVAAKAVILNGATAGQDTGWLPVSSSPERFVYQLDSGTTTTTFSVDISADGVTSLGQAFTGTWSSSALAEITFPIMFSHPLAKFFRWNVVSGGPLSVSRGA